MDAATASVPDRHVHSEWSWDSAEGDMLATCALAIQIGLPAVAFTEHADFTSWAPEGAAEIPTRVGVPDNPSTNGALDLGGYWQAIDRCRSAYPQLRIESGIELGEPHLFAAETRATLDFRPLDRVLGSLHCLEIDGSLVDVSTRGVLEPETAGERMRSYLASTLDMVRSDAPFMILAHLDYPKRYWPQGGPAYDERDYEEEYRAILRALASSGRLLEINSSRAMASPRGPCPGRLGLRWWYEEGGEAISFGSDAHAPQHLASGLAEVASLAELAGFRPGSGPLDLWRR